MKISVKTYRSILLGGFIGSVVWSIFFLVFLLLNRASVSTTVGLPLAFLILAGYFAIGFWASKKYPPSFVKEKNTSP